MTDVELGYDLDPTGYLAGANQIDQANQRLQSSIAGITTTTAGLSKAYSLITPSRATIAGLGLLAQQAAQSQENLSGLSATSAITGTNVGKLAGGIRQMARDMPLGNAATRATVEQFTRMGVGAAGSEAKILALTKTTSKLSGATGDGPRELAAGMVELSRATGNTNLDPKRYEKLGDSLSTISAKSGASATNILSFSKSIAPMAQASGIGATGVIGISSAFARLGEDGLGASTAVNKMLADMNRAVREGSPEMKIYAQMAGKSADEFERLFKSNPAEALTQVTEAIAKAGPQGPRMLEQIGVEGIRGQRSIQALVASGGLRPAIAEATGAYGNGDTNKAAEAAFGGLTDSVNELQEASSQLAEAFGAPLLGPLTRVTDLLKNATAGAGGIVGSRPVQGALTAAAYAGMAAILVKSLSGPLGAALLLRQPITSGPLRSAFAGYVAGRGLPETSRMARYGAGMAQAEADGRMRTGAFGGARGAMYDRALGFGQARGPLIPGTGPGFIGNMRAGIRGYGSNLTGTYFGILSEQARNARVNPASVGLPTWRARMGLGGPQTQDGRRSALGASQGFRNAWQAARTPTDGAQAAGRMQAFTTGMSAFHKEVVASGQGVRAYTTVLGAGARATMQSTAFIGRAMGDVGKGLGGLAKMMGPQLALTAGIGGVMWAAGRQKESSEARGAWLDSDMSATINAYRESIGKATDATQTYAGQAAQTTKNLAASARDKTFSSVKEVTADDITNANQTKDKVVTQYAGSSSDIAAQIQAMAPSGLSSEELQAVKVDLARQLGRDQVGEVLKLIPDSFEAGQRPNLKPNELAGLVGQVAGSASNAPTEGWWAKLMESQADLDQMSKMPGWLRTVATGPGGGLHDSSLTDASRAQIGAINEGIGQQYSSSSTKFGSDYAEQERVRSINAAAKAAYDSGNTDAFYEITSKAGMQLGGKDMKDVIWSDKDLKNADFDFSKLVADRSKTYAATRQQALDAGASFTGEGGLEPELREQQYTKDIRQRSSFLGDVFDPRSKNPASQAMTSSLEAPADLAKQSEAMDAVVRSATGAGKSMSELAIEAAKSAQAVGEGTDAWNRIKAVQQRAEFEMSSQATQTGMTGSEQQIQQYQYYSQLAEIKPEDSASAAQRDQARQQKAQIEAQMAERLKARLQMQRQYEIAVGRANEDFQRQEDYSTQDYERTVFRAERNFNTQRVRAQESFARQMERADEDYTTSRMRTLRDFSISVLRNEQDFQTAQMRQMRDFNISAGRAEKDYQTSRMRQFRDFNTALARQIQDAASSMMDPYTRIQTKATYDGRNLLLNMQEQTEAMAKQKDQLDEMRKLGLSAQTIDVLGLGKAENAQQLNNLLADAMGDPQLIAQLNAQAQAQAQAAGALYTDDSNKELARQREDFQKSLKDQEEDFQKSVSRSREDLNRMIEDQRADYKKALTRSREDLAKSLEDSAKDFAKAMARQTKDFRINLAQSEQDLSTSLGDMEADRNRSMKRAGDALKLSLKRMAEDVAEADLAIAGNMSDLAEQVNRAIHGKAVNWQKILKSDTQSWVTTMQSSVIPQLTKAFAAMGLTAADISVFDKPGVISGSLANATQRADGGPIPGFSPHDRADNVLIRATAGEFMHPVKTVNYYGNDTMERLRRREIPREALQGLADGGPVYKQMQAWASKNIPGMHMTSGLRPGAITATGVVSNHSRGLAIDLAPPNMAGFNKIKSTFGTKNILQLLYSPANGGQIHEGREYNPSATTRRDHWDHIHWAMKSMSGIAAGALGIDPQVLMSILAGAPNKAGIQRALTGKVTEALASRLMSGATGSMSVPGFTGSEDVARWSDETAKVLSMLSRPQSDIGAVLRRIQFESGGNPRAINNWDSNAAKGTPSKGLMQVIDPTFQAYRSKALSTDIYNPMANIYAGSNYAVKRYGSLSAIDPKNRPKGYDSGGWMDPGEGKHVNGTMKPEAVLTNEQWTAISKLADHAATAISREDLAGVNTAAGAHITVNNHQRYTYDQRNDFSGAEVTVVSQDPDDMARKLERKVVAGRLTQTRGVRRNG